MKHFRYVLHWKHTAPFRSVKLLLPAKRKAFKELDWIMECMNDIMETTHSIKEFSEYDFQFHTKIIDYLENEQFSNVFAMFMYRMKRLAELSLAHKGRMEQTYEEHMAIFGLYEEWRYFPHL